MTPGAGGSQGPELVRRVYDAMAQDYAAALPDLRAEAPLDLAMIDAFVDLVGPSARVLDAGCGTGRISRRLADAGLDVTGVDLSPGMLAMARRDHPDLAVSAGSLSELPFAAGRFAGVLLWYSTIHTDPSDQPRIYAEVARALRPGGVVLVAFQTGVGTRDVGAAAYGGAGSGVRLQRHLQSVDEVAARLAAVDLPEHSRLVRRARGRERDGQAFVLAGGASAA